MYDSMFQRFGVTVTDVEVNKAWWLGMSERLAARRVVVDEQEAA